MSRPRSFKRSPFWCAVLLSLVPSLAVAETMVEWAKQRVEVGLVQPLGAQDKKHSRFSRGRPPPSERRVRILQTTFSADKKGNKFVPYAIDLRYQVEGAEWETNIEGCVYQGSADLFVKVGDEYRPAAFLLGQEVDPVPGVCAAAPAES